MIAKYVVTLYLSCPVDPEDNPAHYVDTVARRNLENTVQQLMRRYEGDSDCECVSATTEDNE